MPEDLTASGAGQESATGDTASQALASTPTASASASSVDAAPRAASQADVTAQAADSGATDATTAATTTVAPTAQPAMSLEDALAALEKARKEAAGYRVKARELDTLKQEIADAKLTAEQRLQKQLAEAQAERDRTTTQAQERVVRAEIRSTARELGLKPELALRLLDYAALTYDDDGDPTNVSALLTQAAQDYGIPLASSPAASPASATSVVPGASAAPAEPVAAASSHAQTPARPSAGQPVAPARSATQGAGGALTRDLIAAMSPREYALRRDDVQAWLRTHPNG